AIRDRELEAHHAIVEVGVDGSGRIVQLAGRTPLSIDGSAATHGAIRGGAIIEIGATRLIVGDSAERRGSGVSGPRRGGCESPWSSLAMVERATYLARRTSPYVVDLGIGQVRLALPIDIGALPFDEQSVAD